jgi:uncharacterized membrane protein
MIEIIPNWHPAFVHFPIAFATASVFLVAIGKLFRAKPWAEQCLVFGRWMLWAAAIFACIAAVFGWFAYNSVKHDDAGHLAMTIHRNWALAALVLLVLLAVWAVRSWRSVAEPSNGLLILLIAAWLLVVSAAWHGGEVVYRHGLGVMALPVPEEPGHFHEHGEHPHDAKADGKTQGADGAGSPQKKAGHTHAPGTPPHKD